MKHILWNIVALVLIGLFLASCSSNNDDSGPSIRDEDSAWKGGTTKLPSVSGRVPGQLYPVCLHLSSRSRPFVLTDDELAQLDKSLTIGHSKKS